MAERIAIAAGAKLLGQKIASERKKLRKSQSKLATEAGVERSLISKLEAGHFKTFNGSVQKICAALALNPQTLGCERRLEGICRRIAALSVDNPQLLTAIDGVLNALESATLGYGDTLASGQEAARSTESR